MPISELLVFVLVGTFTPGPNNIMSMERARRLGFWESRFFILGIGTGFFLVSLSSAVFNLLLERIIPSIRPLLSALGVLYMLYLAVKPFVSSKKKALSKPKDEHPYVTGMLLQFLNPKAILYNIALMSSFVLPYTDDLLILILISLGLAVTALTSTASWALFGAIFQRYFSKHEFAINLIMAVLLIWCAVSISGLDIGALFHGRN